MLKLSLAVGVLVAITSCASNPDNIQAAYVSPLKYADYDCQQLAIEMGYIEQRTNTLYQSLKAKRRGDNWQMGVGLILFWPTLFALEGGDGPEATEYAQVKGEYDALRGNVVQKRCSINYQSPDEILSAARDAEAQEDETTNLLTDRLRELESLREQDLISDDEYNDARQRALDNL